MGTLKHVYMLFLNRKKLDTTNLVFALFEPKAARIVFW